MGTQFSPGKQSHTRDFLTSKCISAIRCSAQMLSKRTHHAHLSTSMASYSLNLSSSPNRIFVNICSASWVFDAAFPEEEEMVISIYGIAI